MTTETATLHIEGDSYEFPVITGTENEKAVDLRKLRSTTGMITLDPGFANSGACRSSITFIDGEKGILKYRGYTIEDIAQKATFLETAYLLIYGTLPTRDQLDDLKYQIKCHTMLHEDIKRFYSGFPKKAHPMAVCSAVVGALSAFYPEFTDPDDTEADGGIIRLLAKLPTIAACSYKHSIGQPIMYPMNNLEYTQNFMQMMFATPCEDYEIDESVSRALEILLILHADHEQNCSTSTVRLVGSSQANLFASMSAGISALWGPLHGGANQKVIEMLERIEDGDGSAENFVERAKAGDDTARLMGFGHRVYKNYDPRAQIIKKECRDLLDKIGGQSKLLEIAMKLEEIALNDDYFAQRKLYPNVDFYSGIIYKAIGIPVNMFTVLFAIGRLPGWIAQWREMRQDNDFRIGRPRQIYVGPVNQEFKPVDER
ncbi:MAG: citrate synthase [Planctomycetota bacterium]|nr:citrate synthase [Planctomycetota bacterium]